jgi:hypothetical protein
MSRIMTALLVLVAALCLALPAWAQSGKTTTRPIGDFLSAQGQTPDLINFPDIPTFVTPDKNFLGWSTIFPPDVIGKPDFPYRGYTKKSDVIYFAGIDYAGLATEAYASGKSPEFSGTVTERPLPDGRAEVTVVLHTKGANAWVIQFDPYGSGNQVNDNPTLFGHRPRDVAMGAGQALADTLLHTVFINIKPGAPLPDLMVLANTGQKYYPNDELKFLQFTARAQGPLTPWFEGVKDGTPGMCTVVQTGLNEIQGKTSPISRVGYDAFPAENITLQVIGKGK